MSHPLLQLDGIDIRVDGHGLRTARLRDEYYVDLPDPESLLGALRQRRPGVDVFTFVQTFDQPYPRHAWRMTWDEMAVLPVTTFDTWFDKQIKFKPRNKLRKAWKSGVQTSTQPFDDTLVNTIRHIYDESPLRQGKRNRHYGKDLQTLRHEHESFLERSEFVVAEAGGVPIGFAKLVHGEHVSVIMNIVALVSQRDKAPTNALIAKCVELTAARGIPRLNYGIWGRRGLNEFKVANAFECVAVPRFHVPLTRFGEWALALDMHRGLKERLPERWIVPLADARAAWNRWWYARLAALRGTRPSAPVETET